MEVKRYCPKCAAFVDVGHDYRHCEVCSKCNESGPRYTLRQQAFLERFFEARVDSAYSVSVRDDMWNRKGQLGWYGSVTPVGLNMFFDDPATGEEAWEWGELEVSQVLPESDELDKVLAPQLDRLTEGDRFMRNDGVMLEIERVDKAEGGGFRYHIINRDDWSRVDCDNAFANLPALVDWLPADELMQMKEVTTS